jgi:hypothetical protein
MALVLVAARLAIASGLCRQAIAAEAGDGIIVGKESDRTH